MQPDLIAANRLTPDLADTHPCLSHLLRQLLMFQCW